MQFNWTAYLNVNPDLRRTLKTPQKALEHWHKCGFREGRLLNRNSSLENLDNYQQLVKHNELGQEIKSGISIFTVCMNRNDNLEKAVKSWVDAGEKRNSFGQP